MHVLYKRRIEYITYNKYGPCSTLIENRLKGFPIYQNPTILGVPGLFKMSNATLCPTTLLTETVHNNIIVVVVEVIKVVEVK